MADNNPLLNGYFANPANNNQVTSTKQRSDVNSVLSLAAHQAALDIFKNAGFENVLDKGEKLSAYLIFILNEILSKSPEKPFDIMTPLSPGQRGSQISLKMGIKGKHQFDILKKNRVITAWEAPNVIRLAPAPLYNSFQDVFYFGKILEHAIHLG